MALDDRRPPRGRRGSTRNQSCGEGGNERAEKPRLRTKEGGTPVRKPRLNVPTPKPKEKRDSFLGEIREPKVPGMSLKAATDTLSEFNQLVNVMASAGLEIMKKSGDFAAVEKAQRDLLDELRQVGSEELTEELLKSFGLLREAANPRKYIAKVPVRNPRPGGKKHRYIYKSSESGEGSASNDIITVFDDLRKQAGGES